MKTIKISKRSYNQAIKTLVDQCMAKAQKELHSDLHLIGLRKGTADYERAFEEGIEEMAIDFLEDAISKLEDRIGELL